MMTTENKIAVAKEIARQIGNRALFMMGAMNLVAGDNSLAFHIRGSRECDKIVVTLEASDTYRLDFWQGAIGRHQPKLVKSIDDVYADGLHQAIEYNTGLRLSL